MDKEPIFPLGRVLSTPGARQRVSDLALQDGLIRHQRGDWGEISCEDRTENELALKHGFRLLSAYEYEGEPRFWIITEADRSATTVLLPDEY